MYNQTITWKLYISYLSKALRNVCEWIIFKVITKVFHTQLYVWERNVLPWIKRMQRHDTRTAGLFQSLETITHALKINVIRSKTQWGHSVDLSPIILWQLGGKMTWIYSCYGASKGLIGQNNRRTMTHSSGWMVRNELDHSSRYLFHSRCLGHGAVAVDKRLPAVLLRVRPLHRGRLRHLHGVRSGGHRARLPRRGRCCCWWRSRVIFTLLLLCLGCQRRYGGERVFTGHVF